MRKEVYRIRTGRGRRLTHLLTLRSANMLSSSSRFVCLGTVPEALANLAPPSKDFPAEGSFRSITRKEDCSGAATWAFWKSSDVAVDFRRLNATPNLGIKKVVWKVGFKYLQPHTPWRYNNIQVERTKLSSAIVYRDVGKENNMRYEGLSVT